MDVEFHTDPGGFKLRLEIKWNPLIAFTKAAIATGATLATALNAPQIIHLLAQLGR